MRHRLVRPPRAAMLVAFCALMLAGACKPAARLTIVLDTGEPREGLEVLLVPVDPAPLLREAGPRPNAAQADSIAMLHAARDSADRLDRDFQKLRDALQKEAAALSTTDRRSEVYARKYAEFRPRREQAESLRSGRDAWKSREQLLTSRLRAVLPDSARITAAAGESRRALDAARSGGRSTRSVAADTASISVAVAAGDWWIGVVREGGLPARFQKISARTGERDTLRVRHITR